MKTILCYLELQHGLGAFTLVALEVPWQGGALGQGFHQLAVFWGTPAYMTPESA